MPEGHSVHRIARQFDRLFVGHNVAVSSPQGRFSAGATRLDGQRMVSASAIGKQLFLGFENDETLRVHLGLYGAWEFSGTVPAGDGGETVASIGAPRARRLRMGEQESEGAVADFPPPPVGAVRVRLLTPLVLADLRGPTACEVLEPNQVVEAKAKLGPDPINDPPRKSENVFAAVVLKKPTPIGLILMDQKVVSGIGNVYRAELLFRARLNPYTPGREVPEATVRALWRDWSRLLKIGVEYGQMLTIDPPRTGKYTRTMRSRVERNYVYHRTGLPCRICGTNVQMEEFGGRRLYWCPSCQA